MSTATLLSVLCVVVMLGVVAPMTARDWGAVGCALLVAWCLYKVLEYLDGLGE